jgi:hypothetical protein
MKCAAYLSLPFALALPLGCAAVETYRCAFESGAVVETAYPCTPVLVEKFSKRFIALYPEVTTINTSPDYLMGLYTFAITACTPKFAGMSPEQLGVGSEPFFPKAMTVAMVRAAREVVCPPPAKT